MGWPTLVIGERYAYREDPTAYGESVRPVEVVRIGPHPTQRVRIRWLDGEYEGLEEWVLWRRLLVRWGETEALLDEERKMMAAVEASEEAYDEVGEKVIEQVFGSLSPPLDVEIQMGLGPHVSRALVTISSFEAAVSRLGLDTEELIAEPYAYFDRDGDYKAPFQVALRVAQHCCKRFSEDILHDIRLEEEALERAAGTGYVSYYDSLRRKWKEYPVTFEEVEERRRELELVFAKVREWCGEERVQAVSYVYGLQAEIERLRKLVEETAKWLAKNKHSRKAERVMEELGVRRGPPDPKTPLERLLERTWEN